jgi:mono/diheme cytochrome c family protein
MASPRPDPLAAVDRVLAPLTWLIAAFAIVVLFGGPELIGAAKKAANAQTVAPSATPAGTAAAPAEPASGEKVFVSAGCGGCHTLAAANASGAIGPSLDDLAPDAETVKAIVTSGRGGMPAFGDQLSAAEITAVADYVATSAGG